MTFIIFSNCLRQAYSHLRAHFLSISFREFFGIEWRFWKGVLCRKFFKAWKTIKSGLELSITMCQRTLCRNILIITQTLMTNLWKITFERDFKFREFSLMQLCIVAVAKFFSHDYFAYCFARLLWRGLC